MVRYWKKTYHPTDHQFYESSHERYNWIDDKGNILIIDTTGKRIFGKTPYQARLNWQGQPVLKNQQGRRISPRCKKPFTNFQPKNRSGEVYFVHVESFLFQFHTLEQLEHYQNLFSPPYTTRYQELGIWNKLPARLFRKSRRPKIAKILREALHHFQNNP